MKDKNNKYEKIAIEIGQLVDRKNKAYGNSFSEAGKFLLMLYPNGVPADQYRDMLCVVRIFDKLKRIATNKDALGESPFGDIAGYGLLGYEMDISERKKSKKKSRSRKKKNKK